MKQAFTNPPEHMTKAEKLQYAHDCITKYMKGKKSLRSEGAERAKNIDKYYNLRYASTSPAANQKAPGKKSPVGITAADYLNMPAGPDTDKRLPVNDEVEFIWSSELLVNICGDAKPQGSKEDFLATYLALEKVPAILNQHSQVSVDKAQLADAIDEVKKSPDFNNFVESVSEQDLKDLKEDTKYNVILNKIKQAHDNFKNPEAGMNI